MPNTVLSSGTVSGQIVSSSIYTVISSGVAADPVITAGGEIIVSSGGTAISASVASSGTELVGAGGHASATLVSSGGTVVISSGGSASGTVISGGIETVFSAALAAGTTVSSGGTLLISSGGIASSTALRLGGKLDLAGLPFSAGGSATFSSGTLTVTEGAKSSSLTLVGNYASGFTLASDGLGGTLVTANGAPLISPVIVSAGQTSSYLVPISTTVTVLAGGTTVSTLIGTSSTENVAGGFAAQSVVSGGVQSIGGGGTALATTVLAGGVEILANTTTATFTVVSAGGTEMVASGGIAVDPTVSTGGILLVDAGGIVSGALLLSGAEIDLANLPYVNIISNTQHAPTLTINSATGVLTVSTVTSSQSIQLGDPSLAKFYAVSADSSGGTLITAPAPAIIVSSGQIATGNNNTAPDELVTVLSGGLLSGGSFSGAGTVINVSGGSAAAIALQSGTLDIYTGGVANGATLSGGGIQYVYSGGVSSDTIISSGGSQYVVGLGVTSDTVVNSGGFEYLSNGSAHSISTTVLNGGKEVVSSTTTATDTIVSSGGTLIISSGGTATATMLADGGAIDLTTLAFSAGGTLSFNATTSTLTVTEGAASSSLVLSGSYPGGFALAPDGAGGTLVLAGPITVSSGQTSNGLDPVTTTVTVLSGGTTVSALITSGAKETLSSGGVATATTVSSGGTLVISSGGTATATVLADAGAIDLTALAFSAGGTLSFNATTSTLSVTEGATSSSLTLSGSYPGGFALAPDGAGGTLVLAGPITVSSGQTSTGLDPVTTTVTVLSGGTTVSALITSGVKETLSSGGVASATTVSSGGTLVISSGGTATATVLADAGAIDLTALAFSAGGTLSFNVTTSTLSVTEGATSSSLTLSGSYPGGFALAPDGAGGTLVVAGPITVSSGQTSTGLDPVTTTVTVLSGGTTVSALIASGASETVSSGGIATATTVSSGGTLIIPSGGTASATVLADAGAIDLTALAFSAGGTLSFNATTSTLSVTEGATSSSLTLSGSYPGGFALAPDGAGGTLVVAGPITVSSGQTSNGLDPVTTTVTVLSGGTTLSALIASGASETVSNGGVASATTVSSGGTLVVSSGGTISGTDLLSGGTIDAAGLAFASGGMATYDLSTHLLSVKIGSFTSSFALTGTYTGEFFHLGADGGGGTDITVSTVACYCPGTLIATLDGDRPIEDLQIGDAVVTAGGDVRPIKWIGRRSYAARFASGQAHLQPVRIRAGALGEGLPYADLLVSPLHAMLIGGVLIAATDLVNGTSIVRETVSGPIAYLHLELGTHDVLLANGAASESFVDDASRHMFHNASEYARLYPDELPVPARFCAPRVTHGYTLDAIRRRLDGRRAA